LALDFEIGKLAQPDVSRIASRKGVTEGEMANAYEACQENALNGEIAKSAEECGTRPFAARLPTILSSATSLYPHLSRTTHRYIHRLRLTGRRAVSDSRRGVMNIDCGALRRGVCGMPIMDTAFGACSEYIYLDGQH